MHVLNLLWKGSSLSNEQKWELCASFKIINSSFSSFLFVRYRRQQGIKTGSVHFAEPPFVQAAQRFLAQHVLSKPSLFLLMLFKVIKNYVERLLKLTTLHRRFYVALLVWLSWLGARCPERLPFDAGPGTCSGFRRVPSRGQGMQEAALMCSHIDVSSSPAPCLFL